MVEASIYVIYSIMPSYTKGFSVRSVDPIQGYLIFDANDSTRKEERMTFKLVTWDSDIN